MAISWQAPADVQASVNDRKKDHPHLEQASIAVGFVDSKPFVKNKFNLGKTSQFTKSQKLWHGANQYDFCIMLCADAWHGILDANQRDALVDLHLSRCKVEYEPAVEEENGKKKVVKDEWGCVEYTNNVKYDDDGRPKWKVVPLDVSVFSENVKRHGLWHEDLVNFKHAIDQNVEKK